MDYDIFAASAFAFSCGASVIPSDAASAWYGATVRARPLPWVGAGSEKRQGKNKERYRSGSRRIKTAKERQCLAGLASCRHALSMPIETPTDGRGGVQQTATAGVVTYVCVLLCVCVCVCCNVLVTSASSFKSMRPFPSISILRGIGRRRNQRDVQPCLRNLYIISLVL